VTLKNILFINNDTDVQKRVSDILSRQEDYNLIIAGTTEEACKIIEGKEVSFVLFDVDVALNEGINRMLEMKKKYPDIPIVATTPTKRGEPGDAIAPELKPVKELGR